MGAAEIRERQEFAFEAAVRMRDRFLQQEVWERMGVSPKVIIPYILTDDTRRLFQQMLFSKIVPNCKKLGLLDAADGWLRDRFRRLGVIQFEDWADTGEEYGAFALDRARTGHRASPPTPLSDRHGPPPEPWKLARGHWPTCAGRSRRFVVRWDHR